MNQEQELKTKAALQEIQSLAKRAYKDAHRGQDAAATEKIETIYLLAQGLMATSLTRCVNCGSKPDLSQAKMLESKFQARQAKPEEVQI